MTLLYKFKKQYKQVQDLKAFPIRFINSLSNAFPILEKLNYI